jgi:cyclopropane fatty-acyl-phospholipid synthase-like methyltransferase
MWTRWYHDYWKGLPLEYRSEGGHATSDAEYEAMAAHIAEVTGLRADDRLLDLGCSVGGLTARLAEQCGAARGVDFMEDSIEHARARHRLPNLEFDCADIRSFALGERYDVIVINNVIHTLDSWEDARELLGRCHRALAPGGRLYLGEVPDQRKWLRYARAHRGLLRASAARLMPRWALPIVSRLRGEPAFKLLWYSRRRIARLIGCSPALVSAHDAPGTLLNPLERTHFLVRC